MKYNSACEIEKACSDDTTRMAITEPYFTGKEIVATDGHIMAVVYVDDAEQDHIGYLSGDLIKPTKVKKQLLPNSRLQMELFLKSSNKLLRIAGWPSTIKMEKISYLEIISLNVLFFTLCLLPMFL